MLHKIVQVRNVYNFNFPVYLVTLFHMCVACPNYILNDYEGRDHGIFLFPCNTPYTQ